MFDVNSSDFQKRVEDLMVKIDAEGSAWRETIDIRAGQFLVMQCARNLQNAADELRQRYDASQNKKQLRAHYAAVVMAQGMQMGLASALIAGTATLPNPLEFEAIMRLNTSARSPHAANDTMEPFHAD